MAKEEAIFYLIVFSILLLSTVGLTILVTKIRKRSLERIKNLQTSYNTQTVRRVLEVSYYTFNIFVVPLIVLEIFGIYNALKVIFE